MTLGDLTCTYDPAGNRTKIGGSWARIGLPVAVASATYDAANRQRTFGTATLVYDVNGNLRTATDPSGTATYTWDARNRLKTITASCLTAVAYDALGPRKNVTDLFSGHRVKLRCVIYTTYRRYWRTGSSRRHALNRVNKWARTKIFLKRN